MTTPIAMITDTHFGARGDSMYFAEYMIRFFRDRFIPALEQNGVRSVLMLGDTFDRRKFTNHAVLHMFKAGVFDEFWSKKIHLDIIIGNHDVAYKNTNSVNSPTLFLSDYDNIHLITKPETVKYEGGSISCVPWINPENSDECMEFIRSSESKYCAGHFAIEGFAMYAGMPSQDGLNRSVFQKFDRVFSGHYHHRSSQGNILYLGNPYHLTWQDYGDLRGFYLFDPSTGELQFVPNNESLFLKIDLAQPERPNPHQARGKLIKLLVPKGMDRYELDRYVEALSRNSPMDLKVLEDLSEYNNGGVDDDIQIEDTPSLIQNYVSKAEDNPERAVAINSLMRELYLESINKEVV